MNVVYTFDDGYSEIAAVSLLSLLENNREEKHLDLYIVDCGISEKNKQYINELLDRFGRSIMYIEAKNMEYKIPIKLDVSFWSFVCYVRLFFAELLPDIEKVMHIDCDTIVSGSLSNIYYTDLKGNLCAACYDCIPSPKFVAGFSNNTKYFSNGLLIFDLKAMRENKIQDQFVEYIVNKRGDLPHLDQDVVNAVLKDKIYVIPPEYNLMTYTALFGGQTCELFESDEPYYSKGEVIKAVNNPIMIHLVGYKYVSRPWGQPCYHPYNKEWIDYYKRIGFDGTHKLLNKKKKKYGFVREIVCWIWNLGYKVPFIRNIEFKHEKKKMQKRREMYK